MCAASDSNNVVKVATNLDGTPIMGGIAGWGYNQALIQMWKHHLSSRRYDHMAIDLWDCSAGDRRELSPALYARELGK